MSLLAENFYLFFEGIMLFQVLFFLVLAVQSRRKELLYYSLLNLLAAVYFFLNAPDTFLRINENVVFNWPLYPYVNFLILLSLTLVYLLFLAEIFDDTIRLSSTVRLVFRVTAWLTPVVYILFALFQYNGWDNTAIFYTGHLLNGVFCTLILLKNFRVKGYRSYIIYGMIATFVSVLLTVWLTMRYNASKDDFILDHYPLLPVKVGMLADIILFQAALLGRWQEKQKELAMQKLLVQLEVERVRNRISAELHDDVGSTLSGISMYSHMAMLQAEKEDKKGVGESLQTIRQSSDEMVTRLNDIVWFNKQGDGSTATMTEKLKEYAVMMCRAKGIELKANISEGIQMLKLTEDVAYNIYLICKEAINNAVKYSGASVLSVHFAIQEKWLHIVVKDNGRGFNPEINKNGNGLANMSERAAQIGAVFTIHSSPGHGCNIELKLKITH